MYWGKTGRSDISQYHSLPFYLGFTIPPPGALGVMYQTGQGVHRNVNSAFECLKEAAERGNVYAMGHLVAHFYATKMYTKAAELALR